MPDLLVAVYSLGWVPWWVWIVLAWLMCAVVVGVVVGRAVRRRDLQVPQRDRSEVVTDR